MKSNAFWRLLVLMLATSGLLAQSRGKQAPPANTTQLQILAQKYSQEFKTERRQAIELAGQKGWLVRQITPDGTMIELQRLDANGIPEYYITHNRAAAKSISVDKVWPGGSAGLSLSGQGMLVGEWDGGAVDESHQDLSGRVTQKDNAPSPHPHSTHVAGTLIGNGSGNPAAQGMAYEATLDAYDWNDDSGEMARAAAGGLLISNHSYGMIRGWRVIRGSIGKIYRWYGNPSISETEDYKFGFYGKISQRWDQIAFDAPYYLICKSAGNDRNDTGPPPGEPHQIIDPQTQQWVESTVQRDNDGPNDCIGMSGTSKNILTVGAVNDIPNGYQTPGDVQITSFSSWGPADDGRIKPDIVVNGHSLLSTVSNNQYQRFSGTSMASPSAAGALLLLQQHYQATHQNQKMRAATLKGLAIHTADEAGSYDGPDYQFGWGLLNIAKAAQLISQDGKTARITEKTLNNGAQYTFNVQSSGLEPLIATICWSDPPGTPPAPRLDPRDKMLVNDLDLRISGNNTRYMPWRLDPTLPASPATRGDNNTDNVEKIELREPQAGIYTVTISHKGRLKNSRQAFSVIISGASLQMTPIKKVGNSTIPDNFIVKQNYPNPFNPSTHIAFGLPKTSRVKVSVYNPLGQHINTPIDQRLSAGYHQVKFDAGNLPAGLYFYKVESGDFRIVKKMLLLK